MFLDTCLLQMSSGKALKKAPLTPVAWALLIAFGPASSVLAQGVALERELEAIHVTGQRSSLDPNLPASTFSITKEDTNNQNMVNVQNALDYAPNMVVRKLKMSDRSGGISTRNSGVGQPMRTLIYADGMLLTNFGGNSHDVARWNTVTPEEVSRYDILYGPYSAIYPGNSIGTTVAITTRKPEKLEFSGRVLGYGYTQSNFGIKQSFQGHTENIYLGNRWGNFAASIALENTLANTHGTGYAYLVPAGAGAATAVSGAVTDADTFGKRRYIAGTSGMEDSKLQVAKIKLYYDFTPTLSADLTYNRIFNNTVSNSDSVLRDAFGNTVWGGRVRFNGANYTVGAMNPREGEEDHQQIGLRLRTRNKTGWNYSVQASDFRMLKSSSWTSSQNFGQNGGAGVGSLVDTKGTGWNTFEVQATYTPAQELGHALSFGYHRNTYKFKSETWNLNQWRDSSTRTTMSGLNEGSTTVQALYAQDSWRFRPNWTLTAGLRAEQFNANDGKELAGGITTTYDKRTFNALSPKLSLAHEINEDWTARMSYGRGVRFPTAPDLFKGVKVGTDLVQPNPNLQPEVSDSKELSFTRETGNSNFRASLYEDDIKDAIWNQTTLVPNGGGITSTFPTNVDRVRTRGLELAYTQKDLFTPGFDLTGNVAFIHSRIMKNAVDPTVVGNQWAGLPNFRANLLASYRRGDWQGSLGVRHEGMRPRSLANKEVNQDTYGGGNAYTVADARVSWSFNKWGSLAFGVNNLTDAKYYEVHPYAGRTFFAELKVKY